MEPTIRAAVYVRRSAVSADSPGDASREGQLAAIKGPCSLKKDRAADLRLKADIEARRVGSACA